MPAQPSGNPISGGSACPAVGEHDLQLAEHHVPILAPGVPMLDDPLGGQIQHPPQRIVVGERGLVLRDLPELTIQTLDDVRRVYDFPDLRRIFKERAQNLPVILPALNAGGILLPPGIPKGTQIPLCLLKCDSGIDLLQVGYDLLDVLVADVLGGTANLMNDAALQAALGIHCLDRLHHAAKTVGTEQVNVQNTPAFEVIQHAQPKFAALMLPNPHAQNVFSAVHGDTQDHIGGLGHIAVILFDLIVDSIHEDEEIDAFQWTVLPGVDLRHDLLADFADQLRGDLYIVQTPDLLSDIPLAHTAGVQGQNLVLHAFGVAVIFADDLRLIVALAVPGNLDVNLTQLCFDGLLRVAISVVGRGAFRVCGTLAPLSAKFLVHLYFHDLLDDIPEHFLHGRHDVGGAGKVLALNILLQKFLWCVHNTDSFVVTVW